VRRKEEEKIPLNLETSEMFGLTTFDMKRWPTQMSLNLKPNATLKNLRINKIEWHADVYISSLRLTLNDGSVSPQIGQLYEPKNSFTIPEDRKLHKIKIQTSARAGVIYCMDFLDFDGNQLFKIEGNEWLRTNVTDLIWDEFVI